MSRAPLHEIRRAGPARFARFARLARLARLALLALLTAGCDRNAAEPFLVPTGIRPPPPVGTASLTGSVVYDPQNCPDLGTPPYPATLVELAANGVQVAVDTLGPDSRTFVFRDLQPGIYTVYATSPFFLRSSIPPVRVLAGEVDAGDLLMPVNPLASSVGIHLFGDFNGFPADFPDSTRLDQNTLGIWSYPNADYPAQVLPAGTYRIRFVTDFSVDNPTDYGGDATVVLDAPLSNEPVRLVSGPVTDLSIRIPAEGRYAFTLDERRSTFSVQPLAGPDALTARRRPR